MAAAATSRPRVTLDGKFFRLGEKKFYVKGVSYGPFAPTKEGGNFPPPAQARRDLELIRELGANVLRVYYTPPRWLLDLALELDLRLFVDIPWGKHLCFLDSEQGQDNARTAIRQAVQYCAAHPGVFAFSVVNELSPDIVRWSGAPKVAEFMDELVNIAKEVDPECLCTMGNYPPTEFLRPQNLDFVCFNVYLHQPRPFENYLARLQMIADNKPLILGEFGIDTLREGEPSKCEMLDWQIETVFRSGLAGAVVYSFTDDWFKDNRQVEDWGFGLTTREREKKESFHVVKRKFTEAPYFPLAQYPKVSVVVASYNGARTLKACLESLEHLNYPNYEVLLVDDGSTDTTQQIAVLYKNVRHIYQIHQGLSVARNTGIYAGDGDVVAFTDSDCRADEDWLYYLVGDLLNSKFAGIGGHNFLPPEDSQVAAAVQVSPGAPAHVMLTDRVAEHIPGCNMAFYKWALLEIGCFDPLYKKAGDDVDVCWRLQQRGYKLGFSPGGFVWHYRRSTMRAYLRQQQGYGEAEALLVRRHPENFNSFGGGIWHGRIYASSKFGPTFNRPIIYHGLFASGFFQTLYQAEPAEALMLCTSLEYHVIVNLPLLVLSVPFHYLLPLAIASLLLSLGVCVAAAWQANLPKNKKRFWSRPLITLLFLLQPIVRGWARYRGRIALGPTPRVAYENLDFVHLRNSGERIETAEYWSEKWIERIEFVRLVIQTLEKQGWQYKADSGWSDFDIEIFASRWGHLYLTSVVEPHANEKVLLRCRMKTAWSLFAKLSFGTLAGLELLVIGIFRDNNPWLWLLLLTLPLFAWFIDSDRRNLQRVIVILLDEVAGRYGAKKFRKPVDPTR
ncbi:MAG: glycosyl transferase family 2 [Verrucomicrobiales bacterium]|nr:glycosyl transferase family 2 [Verrucomicrobiales bacterium]